ncbi:DNA topoisomerase [Colibacter massiliensis]|uniref:DNA topoisomerase n=1 Tax=Colibacter massiliensis TaxID=1852379 RepID=UPI003F8DBCCB
MADSKQQGRAFDDKKISAHHAIIPTGIRPKELSEMQQAVFAMIAQRYVCQFLLAHEYEQVNFTLQVADETFTGSGKLVKVQGFKAFTHEKDKPLEDDGNLVLPELQQGEELPAGEYAIKEKKTTPPKRFTEGTLLAAMANIWRFVASDNPNREKLKEVKGIGTPATRDTIIAELQVDNLKGNPVEPCLKKVRKELVPTDFGMELIANVDESLIQPDTTAIMEYRLTEIAQGKLGLTEYLDELITMLYDNLRYAENRKFPIKRREDQVACPICNEGFLVRKYSPKTKQYFFMCSNPDCVNPSSGRKMFYDDNNGNPVIEKCPVCQEPMAHIKGKGDFWLCSKCNKTYDNRGGHAVRTAGGSPGHADIQRRR